MTTTTQQFPSNPALDFANAILEETNGALELIEILHDIAQGVDERATSNDRIAAANILMDRGLGKCPKQISPNPGTSPDPDTSASSDSPKAKKEAESPRLVTQIDDSLHRSLGPAPSVHTQEKPAPASIQGHVPISPDPFDPSSIQSVIQQHILTITNNGQTLRDTLEEIARATDDPKVKPLHRTRAARILIDRILGTDPNALRNRQSWTTHTCSTDHTEPAQETPYRRPVRYVDPVALAEVRAEIQRMKDEGILTPDPNRPKLDTSKYRMPKDFDPTPYAAEEAAKFRAEIELRYERQQNWPKIEERRRQKLAQIYPSHSDDDHPPDP